MCLDLSLPSVLIISSFSDLSFIIFFTSLKCGCNVFYVTFISHYGHVIFPIKAINDLIYRLIYEQLIDLALLIMLIILAVMSSFVP